MGMKEIKQITVELKIKEEDMKQWVEDHYNTLRDYRVERRSWGEWKRKRRKRERKYEAEEKEKERKYEAERMKYKAEKLNEEADKRVHEEVMAVRRERC